MMKQKIIRKKEYEIMFGEKSNHLKKCFIIHLHTYLILIFISAFSASRQEKKLCNKVLYVKNRSQLVRP